MSRSYRPDPSIPDAGVSPTAGTPTQGPVPVDFLRCPVCRSIDWVKDGYSIPADARTGEVLRRRVEAGFETPIPCGLAACAVTGPRLGAMWRTNSGQCS